MNGFPLLDGRSKRDLFRLLVERAGRYTPEWRPDEREMDAGAALADLFCGMLFDTICRYNRFPHQAFLYFLDLLDTRRAPAAPASGYVRFEARTPENGGVPVERGTQVYAEGEGEDIVFETRAGFDATPAEPVALLLVHPERDCVERYPLPLEGPVECFAAHPEKNLQSHLLYLGHPDLFRLSSPCVVEVEPRAEAELLNEQTARRLAEAPNARWEYFSGGEWRPFDHTESRQGRVLLTKTGSGPLEPFEDGTPPCIRCVMGGGQGAIRLRSLAARAAPLEGAALSPEELYSGDLPIDREAGGYCFGREPAPYDCFYVGSAEAFSKGGALLKLELEMSTVRVRRMEADRQYEFNKYIIDKDDRIAAPPEVFVSEAVWEYWNGTGWKHLPVRGDANPFSCKKEGALELTARCPEDWEPVAVGAAENLWLRARVAFVENQFSAAGDRLLPFLRRARLSYSYEAPVPVPYVRADNNCESRVLTGADRLENLALDVFLPLEKTPPALYLCFDRPVRGYPANLFFDLDGPCGGLDSLEVQTLTRNGFQRVNALDRTDRLSGGGLLGVYLSEPPEEGRLFGLDGYFLRILGARRARDGTPPKVARLLTNVAEVVQSRRETEQLYDTGIHEAGLELTLPHRPVLSCEVWVDALAGLSQRERDALLENPAAPVLREYGEEGVVTRLRTRWDRVDSFAGHGPDDRVYLLDPAQGRVTFGDGRRGKVPAAGEESVLVRYTSGGGARGNLPAGAITGIIGSIPHITEVAGVTPTCGGSDLQPMSEAERLGPRRVRHRYRAICARDYEDIVSERFGEVSQVRCFPNTGADGNPMPGAVTVVVMARDYADRDYARRLCRRIREDLEGCCDCMALPRLTVIPAVVMTVNVAVRLLADSPEHAARIEREAAAALKKLLEPEDGRGGIRGIGELPSSAGFFARLKELPHVAAVREVFLEGCYYEGGRPRLVSLDGSVSMPFAVVRAGTQRIRL